MTTTDRPIDAAWSLQSPSGPGPVALIAITGDVDGALEAIGVRPVLPGDVRLRSIAGVDEGLVARWNERDAHLMPHAGPAVVRGIIAALNAAGIPERRDAPWPEAGDEIEARMLSALARAASPLAVDLLLDQPRRWASGAEPDPAHSAVLDRLLDPPLVVAVGASNIGKSTLANALAGRSVALVAGEPATTRDPVGVRLDLGGLVVRYVDTPGRLEAASPVDAEAARLAAELSDRADLLLCCADAPGPAPAPPGNRPALVVALRADLADPAFPHDVAVSVHAGRGLDHLATAVREALVPEAAIADPRPWRFWPVATPD